MFLKSNSKIQNTFCLFLEKITRTGLYKQLFADGFDEL